MPVVKGIIVLFSVLLMIVQSASGISNVQHSVNGNKVTLTYQGVPPFYVNIRPDTNIGQDGGYLWAKTNSPSFSYDMGFAINPSNRFYYGVKDAEWSATDNFLLNSPECAEEAVIFREKNKNEYFVPKGECHPDGWCQTDDYVYFDVDSFLDDFYENSTDSYDFLIVNPQIIGLQSNYHMRINSLVEGIGEDVHNHDRYERLQAVTLIDLYRSYQAQVNNPDGITLDSNLLNNVIFHEITHQWCCFIDGVGNSNHELPGHWVFNLDLFSGDEAYGDIMGYYQWIRKEDGMVCTDNNDEETKHGFSDLTLYLAGLIPKENVSPVYLHEFQASDNENYNTWGPTCQDDPTFLGTKEITIQDIIEANGERVPDYASSQKDFVFRYVIVVPYDAAIDPGFSEYVHLYLSATPSGWSQVTRNTSTAKIC